MWKTGRGTLIRKPGIYRYKHKNHYVMNAAKPALLLLALLISSGSIARQIQHNNKRVKPKQKAAATSTPSARFNLAAFSEKRTLVQEQRRIPGTDSVVTETYYVWLLPK